MCSLVAIDPLQDKQESKQNIAKGMVQSSPEGDKQCSDHLPGNIEIISRSETVLL